MKVLLLQDVRSQGKKGEIINVSEGYARNFLFPKKFAVEATASIINEFKMKAASAQYKKEEEKKEALSICEKLDSITVKLSAVSGTDGRFYGSITSKEISEALKEQFGIDIEKRKIVLAEPIKAYGNYELTVKLFSDVQGKLNVLVSEKQ